MKRILIICLLIPFMTAAMFAVDIVYPTGLTITGYNGPILEGNTLQLQAVPTPSNTSYKVYKWSSGNTSVATVDKNGLVTAVAPGTAQIKCLLTANEQNFFAVPNEQTATCTITVEENTELAITFADAEVKRICVENWDANHDGELSLAEAAAVTDLGQVFKENSVITSFDELHYFTGLTTISDNAFQFCDKLQQIQLPATLTSVGARTFQDCSSLTSVTLPEGLKTISMYAFAGCNFTNVVIPGSVETIGYAPFVNNNNLTSIVVEPANAYFDSRNNCNAIIRKSDLTLIQGCKSSTIPEGIVKIGTAAFEFVELTSISLPQSLEEIGSNSFYGITTTKNIVLPPNLKTIGDYAFTRCSALTAIVIPSSVTYIGNNPFLGCSNIESVTVEAGNTVFDSRDNCNAIIETSNNMLIFGCQNTVIPNTVTRLADQCFRGQSKLTEMIIPEQIEEIPMYTFCECYGLKSVTLHANIKSIGENAFSSTNLTSVIAKMPAPVAIAANDFSSRANATLYVPFGCKAAYQAADYWKEFKDIVELSTDISQLTDAIYIKPFKSGIDGNRMMEVCLKNAQPVTAYVFDIVLPEGVSVATDGNNKYIDALGSRHDDHLSAFNYRGSNTYSLAALSGKSEELTDNDNAIRLLTLQIDDDLAEGFYSVNIKNASYAKPDGTLVKLDDTTTSITIIDCAIGDANSDGHISVTDIAVVVNCILQLDNEQFSIFGADANGDGQITVTDIGVIVDMILGTNSASSRELKDLEPQ